MHAENDEDVFSAETRVLGQESVHKEMVVCRPSQRKSMEEQEQGWNQNDGTFLINLVRAGTIRGSLAENTKWLPLISELITKPSFLSGRSIWKKLGLGEEALLLGQGSREALLVY